MNAKATKKTVRIDQLVVDKSLNVRLADQYDLNQMVEGLLEFRRIVKPIIAMKKDDGSLVVLSGNRRTLAGQQLFNDPSCPTDLKEQLGKVDVMVYDEKDLSEEDRLKLIVDHGSEKPISKTEMVLTVWRLARQLFSERQIIGLLYFALARYTGNEKRLTQLPTGVRERDSALSKWFHGTVGNYILAALRMPEYVRQQFLLTHKSQDGILSEGEKLVVRCSRERITALSQAKTTDEKQGAWDPENGGPTFKETWERFVREDSGEEERETRKRPTEKDIRQLADNFLSPLVRKTFLASVGEPSPDLIDLDAETFRLTSLIKTVKTALEGKKVPKHLTELFKILAHGKSQDLEAYLENTK